MSKGFLNDAIQERIYFITNAIGMFLLGLMSLGYIIFVRDVAELHFKIPLFGGLPLFFGEILWASCFLLVIIQLVFCARVTKYPLFNGKKVSLFWASFAAYLVWILLKVIFGLKVCGPLALRHAALFYYPLFAFYCFLFFDRKFFSKEIVLILMGIILLLFGSHRYNDYWTITLAALAIILFFHLRYRWLKVLMGALLFLTIPYYRFFMTSRMMIVSNSFSLSILAVGLWRGLNLKKLYKVIIMIFFMWGAIVLAIHSLYINNPGRIFNKPKEVIEEYNLTIKEVERLRKDYKPIYIAPKLYSPDKPSQIFKKVESLTETSFLTEPNKFSMEDGKVVILSDDSRGRSEIKSINYEGIDKKSEEKGIHKKKEEEIVAQEIKDMVPVSDSAPDVEIIPKKAFSLVLENERIRNISLGNILFRLFMWRDMCKEWIEKKPLFGFHFGHPFRSESLEVLGWGMGDWARLGWIEPHNSYLHILYRSGILGLVYVGVILGFAIWILIKAFAARSLILIMLSAAVWNWIVAANFLINFEIPYMSIPFWALFGMSIRYVKDKSSTG